MYMHLSVFPPLNRLMVSTALVSKYPGKGCGSSLDPHFSHTEIGIHSSMALLFSLVLCKYIAMTIFFSLCESVSWQERHLGHHWRKNNNKLWPIIFKSEIADLLMLLRHSTSHHTHWITGSVNEPKSIHPVTIFREKFFWCIFRNLCERGLKYTLTEWVPTGWCKLT